MILVIGAGSRTGQALVPLLRAAAVPLSGAEMISTQGPGDGTR